MRVVPIRSGLASRSEHIFKLFALGYRALSDECDAVGPIRLDLKYAVPVLRETFDK